MTTKRHRRAHRRRALQSARDARKRTGRAGFRFFAKERLMALARAKLAIEEALR